MTPTDDVLDPRRLSLMTPWAADHWTQALAIAREAGIPDSALISLISHGAWPGLIAGLPNVLKAIVPPIEKMTQIYEQVKPHLPPSAPADPRGRALWLRQHRNTGPHVVTLSGRRSEWKP